ncbi:hypothetical protein AUP68_07418 [Ilyonectria robusta]
MVREQHKAGWDPEITCFFEELPLPVIRKVVSKDSATLEGYNAISIHASRQPSRYAKKRRIAHRRRIALLIIFRAPPLRQEESMKARGFRIRRLRCAMLPGQRGLPCQRPRSSNSPRSSKLSVLKLTQWLISRGTSTVGRIMRLPCSVRPQAASQMSSGQ